MQIIKAVPGVPFSIGRQGENQARQVQIDLTPWVGLYGPGNAELIYQRPGESTSYPVAIERNGNLVLWTVTHTDTALASAPQDRVYGRAELRYYVDDTLVKSEISAVSVYASMEIPSEVPAPPGQNWLDQALAAGAQAKEAATKAEAAIEKAPYIGENGNWFIWNAVSGTYEDTGRFSGGGAGSNVAIDPTLTQEGQAADAKAVGDAISQLSKAKLDADKLTEAVNNALEQAKSSGEFDGADGAPGKDGKDGAPGPAGADGKTPAKGTDYFTEADKAELVDSVLAALPTWEGGSY